MTDIQTLRRNDRSARRVISHAFRIVTTETVRSAVGSLREGLHGCTREAILSCHHRAIVIGTLALRVLKEHVRAEIPMRIVEPDRTNELIVPTRIDRAGRLAEELPHTGIHRDYFTILVRDRRL